MNKLNRIFLFLGIVLFSTTSARARDVVSVVRQDQQPVSIVAYTPKNVACRGVAIVSPGAGGSEQGYAYLGEMMSSMGYLSVVVGHQESGRHALRSHMRDNKLQDALSELITDPDAYRGRFMDIAAAKKWAAAQCAGSESILIGHSMGAATTMIEAGANNKLGVQGANSFNLYIAMSPQGEGSIFPRNAWSGINSPVLLFTGTRDKDLNGNSWQTRTEPFASMPAGCKWLGVIDHASHMNFAGRGLSRKTEQLINQVISAFITGVHRGDCRSGIRHQSLNLQIK